MRSGEENISTRVSVARASRTCSPEWQHPWCATCCRMHAKRRGILKDDTRRRRWVRCMPQIRANQDLASKPCRNERCIHLCSRSPSLSRIKPSQSRGPHAPPRAAACLSESSSKSALLAAGGEAVEAGERINILSLRCPVTAGRDELSIFGFNCIRFKTCSKCKSVRIDGHFH